MKKVTVFSVLSALFLMSAAVAEAQSIKGVIVDAKSGEMLIGAFVEVVGGTQNSISALDGS